MFFALLCVVVVFTTSAFAVEVAEEPETETVGILDIQIPKTPILFNVVGDKFWPKGIFKEERTIFLPKGLTVTGVIAWDKEHGQILVYRDTPIRFSGMVQIVPSQREDGNDFVNAVYALGAAYCVKEKTTDNPSRIVEGIPAEEVVPGAFWVITGIVVIPPPPVEEEVKTPEVEVPEVDKLFWVPYPRDRGVLLELSYCGWITHPIAKDGVSQIYPSIKIGTTTSWQFPEDYTPMFYFEEILWWWGAWGSNPNQDALGTTKPTEELFIVGASGGINRAGKLEMELRFNSVEIEIPTGARPYVEVADLPSPTSNIRLMLVFDGVLFRWIRPDFLEKFLDEDNHW